MRGSHAIAHPAEDDVQDATEPPRPSAAPAHGAHAPHAHLDRRRVAALSLTALGVVYGDIGTSPLYALRECFYGEHGVRVNPENILGVLSLVFWALVVVVTVKYHVYVLRADNHGEGGILALLALIPARLRQRGRGLMVAMGLFGAALLYGDGIITPAISVLSAVEGVQVATPVLSHLVVPITLGILIGLFLFQKKGTGGVGAIFGPIMLVWFATLVVLGVRWIVRAPHVLVALNPVHAITFFAHNGPASVLVLGAVFLVCTGGEALYADMGHFGELPIQIDWFGLVGVSLMTNYLGQGALLLLHPEAAQNPFYLMAPAGVRIPLVLLATVATVIASQAIISGAFSLTRQAIQLGYLPRMKIIHTSAREMGQIYLPTINWLLMVSTAGLVIAFEESARLAAAYGVAVSLTMLITTLLAYQVAHHVWGWRRWVALLVTGAFLVPDLAFLVANMAKILDGGWFPLLVGGLVFLVMTIWRNGRVRLGDRLRGEGVPFEAFVAMAAGIPRVPGMAVFMARDSVGTPAALLHNLKHNQVLHEKVVLLTVRSEDVPYVAESERVTAEDLGEGFYRVVARSGFMESPQIEEILAAPAVRALDLDTRKASFFLSRVTLLPSKPLGPPSRERVFINLYKNSLRPVFYFGLPPNRVVELGRQVRL
ncbi:MAG TPA: KUP/HAK/KT family potassium transporter [Thermoanaerobaculia bacterium]|jgi:KUP system potassium uptake protein|nr:KUP/HAK/KT family potassium transporter [Thermoanaerobaculia bacterium]